MLRAPELTLRPPPPTPAALEAADANVLVDKDHKDPSHIRQAAVSQNTHDDDAEKLSATREKVTEGRKEGRKPPFRQGDFRRLSAVARRLSATLRRRTKKGQTAEATEGICKRGIPPSEEPGFSEYLRSPAGLEAVALFPPSAGDCGRADRPLAPLSPVALLHQGLGAHQMFKTTGGRGVRASFTVATRQNQRLLQNGCSGWTINPVSCAPH